jgi:hypothetical protein
MTKSTLERLHTLRQASVDALKRLVDAAAATPAEESES